MFRQLFFSPSEKLLLHQIINLPPMTKPCLVFHIFAERPPIRGKPKYTQIQQINCKYKYIFPKRDFPFKKNKIQQINLQFSPLHYLEVKNKIFVKELQLLSNFIYLVAISYSSTQLAAWKKGDAVIGGQKHNLVPCRNAIF